MIYVTVKNDEPFERALRRFKKKWEKAGVLREVRARSFYLKPSEQKKIARSKKNNDGVYIVPAFSGMGAPYWRPDARGLITGLTRNSDWKSLVRAVLESVAYQSYDLFNSMRKDGLKPSEQKKIARSKKRRR